MGDSVARVNKPQMRGLLHASIKRNLIISLVLAGASAVAFKVLVGDARKKKYAEFYKWVKNLDIYNAS